MNLKFMKCGLLALACLALSFGQAKADIVINTNTKGVGGTLSVNLGAISGTLTSGTEGTSPTLVMTYTVTGLDLSAEEAGSTAASFQFAVTYSSNTTDDVDFTGGGNAGVDGTTINTTQTLSVGVSDAMNIMGFGGTISLDGITGISVSGFTGTSDQANFVLSDSSSILLIGANDTNGGTATGDSATIAAALGITGFDQSAAFGSSGFRTLGTQFTATAVPEPTSLVMFGVCGLGLFMRRRK